MSPSPEDAESSERPDQPRGPGPGDNPYVDEGAAADRTADAGPLFDEAYRPGESGTSAGLVAGSPDDPVLVAGVGYPLLGDLAVGTVVAYRVAALGLPGVAVADCSNTPVAAYQTITDGDHGTLVVVGPEKRGGDLNDGTPSESPGAVHEYDADEFEAPDDRIVDLVGESAMGSNTVENVLVVSRTLGELPPETHVLTVEPGYDSWGLTVEEFTDPVDAVLDDVTERVLGYIEAAAE
jgi:Ni,Fe-hydrogenase maturation factor